MAKSLSVHWFQQPQSTVKFPAAKISGLSKVVGSIGSAGSASVLDIVKIAGRRFARKCIVYVRLSSCEV